MGYEYGKGRQTAIRLRKNWNFGDSRATSLPLEFLAQQEAFDVAMLKKVSSARGLIRTGNATPYANIIFGSA
jgi:hypothetical protein